MKAHTLTGGLTDCTQDEWCDRMNGIGTYQTEGNWPQGYPVMYSHQSTSGIMPRNDGVSVVGEVHYLPDGGKLYKILPE